MNGCMEFDGTGDRALLPLLPSFPSWKESGDADSSHPLAGGCSPSSHLHVPAPVLSVPQPPHPLPPPRPTVSPSSLPSRSHLPHARETNGPRCTFPSLAPSSSTTSVAPSLAMAGLRSAYSSALARPAPPPPKKQRVTVVEASCQSTLTPAVPVPVLALPSVALSSPSLPGPEEFDLPPSSFSCSVTDFHVYDKARPSLDAIDRHTLVSGTFVAREGTSVDYVVRSFLLSSGCFSFSLQDILKSMNFSAPQEALRRLVLFMPQEVRERIRLSQWGCIPGWPLVVGDGVVVKVLLQTMRAKSKHDRLRSLFDARLSQDFIECLSWRSLVRGA